MHEAEQAGWAPAAGNGLGESNPLNWGWAQVGPELYCGELLPV